MSQVRVLPDDVTIEIPEGTSVFEALRGAKVAIASACGGKGQCGLCRVKVIEGGDALGPVTNDERRHLGSRTWLARERLSCQIRPDAELTVEIAKGDSREERRARVARWKKG